MRRAARPLALAAFAVLAALAARADEPGKGKPAEKPVDPPAKAPAGEKPEKYNGIEIRWARSWIEAQEEAAERNVPIFLHSHGST
jgi:hypothetical protein